MKQPSMRMVAEHAGVSLATVSYLLNNNNGRIRVSNDTKSRVLEVCNKLGYERNVHAQRMFSNKSKTLGIIIPPNGSILGGENSPDFGLAAFLQGVTNACQKCEYQVVVNSASESFFEKKEYLRLYRSKSVDALVIWGICLDSSYVLDLYNRHLPFVLVQTRTSILDKKYNFIGSDDAMGAERCVDHLFELGHRRIGYVRGSQISSAGVDRWEGYCRAMNRHHLECEKLVAEGDYSFNSGKLGAAKLLDKDPNITAIACANDLMAAGVIEFIEEKGLSVPKDISVTGGDAVPHFWGKQITSFNVSVYDMATKATENIIRLISLPTNEEKEVFRDVFDSSLRIGKTTTVARE